MTNKMLRFVERPSKRMPDKREVASRRRDFDEIYQEFDPAGGRSTGGPLFAVRRAVLPGPLPAAQQHPDWLMLTAEGRLEEAYEIVKRPTISRRSVAGSAPRTGSARATA